MNDRQMTKHQADLLAAFLSSVRPTYAKWDAPGIIKALGEAKQRPGRPDVFQIATAAIRAAGDPTNRTPKIIALDGAHWRPVHPDDEPKATPTPTSIEDMRCKCGLWVVRGEPHTCGRLGDAKAGADRARAALAARTHTEENET